MEYKSARFVPGLEAVMTTAVYKSLKRHEKMLVKDGRPLHESECLAIRRMEEKYCLDASQAER